MELYCIMNKSGEFLVSRGFSKEFFADFDLKDMSNNEEEIRLQCWFEAKEAEMFAEEYCSDVEWKIVRLIGVAKH